MLQGMLGRLLAIFNPDLPRKVWLFQLGVLINFLGNGMVAPFLIIYLHFGRGIPLAVAGSAVALGGITAVTSGLLAGSLSDRIGPRNTLIGAMVCNAVAYLLYTQVRFQWEAFAVGLLVGVGTGAHGPSSQNLTAAMVPPENRQAALAQNRVTAVVGLGLGGTIGGIVAARGLEGYLQLLVLDAITFLTFAVVLLKVPSGRAQSKVSIAGSYALVMRDRAFLRLVGVSIAMVAAGIAPMLVLLPAYAKLQAHVSEPAIGFAAVIYASGECLYSAIVVPTAAALAPDHLRGRYLGVVGLAWQTGFMLGPSLGGAVLGAFPLGLPVICAAVCLLAALVTGAVDRALPPAQTLVPVPLLVGRR